MKPKKRQKLCANCEGEVDLDVIVCPFCAADLREDKEEMGYSSPTHHYGSRFSELTSGEPEPSDRGEWGEEGSLTSPGTSSGGRSWALSIFLLAAGLQLLFLSLSLLLLSSGGVLLLKWNANHWMVYGGISLPLLYLGYKRVSLLQD